MLASRETTRKIMREWAERDVRVIEKRILTQLRGLERNFITTITNDFPMLDLVTNVDSRYRSLGAPDSD